MRQGYLSYLIELLNADEWIGKGECIDIAKGKYHIPSNWQDTKKIIRRRWLKK